MSESPFWRQATSATRPASDVKIVFRPPGLRPRPRAVISQRALARLVAAEVVAILVARGLDGRGRR